MDQQLKNSLFFLGRPLSPLYSSAMKTRTYLYRKGLFKQHRLKVPVISVGNLTMGGTGKTPFVIYLARLLKNKGFNPAVVSRGYRGKSSAAVNIVSDGCSVLLSPEEAGDEPVLIAEKIPSVVVATGKKRYHPATAAVENYQSDIILLDDGFQHLGLYRDLDLVLFDIDHFAGNSRVFPGGELREPVSALNRCDAFILTGHSDVNADRTAKIEELLLNKFPDKRVFAISRTFSGFYRYEFSPTSIHKTVSAGQNIPAKVFAFSGIAHPRRFYQMLEAYGVAISATRDFVDHHTYSKNDIAAICKEAAGKDCSALITTEKDIVKLNSSHQCSLPVFVPELAYAPNDNLSLFISDRLDQK